MSIADLSWTEMAAETTATVEMFSANEAVFALFAGAVYALHQDTLRASAVDMASADDTDQAAAINAAQPSPMGDFAARLIVTSNALRQVESANRGVIGQAPHADNDERRVAIALARLRLTAARLWLLTLQARVGDAGGAGLRVGVAGLWSRLQTVPPAAIAEGAAAFTGTFYSGVRTCPIDVAAWPLSP